MLSWSLILLLLLLKILPVYYKTQGRVAVMAN